MTWLPLLLADGSACLRWLVLRDLYCRPADDPEMVELAALRQHDPLVKGLVAMQESDGSWRSGVLAVSGRSGNRVQMTAFALARLGYLGFDAAHPAVQRGAEFLFRQQQPDGAWPTGIAAGVFGGVAGYRKLAHSRWGCRTNTTAAALRLALHPQRRLGEPARRALDLLLERETQELSGLGLETARLVEAEPPHGFFTYFARFDLALILDLCGRVELSIEEPRLADLSEYIRSLQGKYGLWENLQWPQAARWLTFDLLRSPSRFDPSILV